MTGWKDVLKTWMGKRFKEKEILGPYTSLKVGGPADLFFVVDNREELREVLLALGRASTTYFVLGNGSNLLVSDRGVRGAVIRLGKGFDTLRYTEKEGERGIFLHAGAASLLPKLARQSVKRGYTGLEFAEGVPGTVGGAVTMNAGAYGAEMERVVEEIEAMTPGGEALLFHRAELSFRYRGSSLPANLVITEATFRLEHGDGENERRKIEEFRKRRKLAQPSGSPNAGSIFRNPPGDYAGRLVETAGLKGLRRGQAQVSTKHGNFIVNLGGARSEEIRSLMEEVRAGVREKTGVELEPEIRFVGEWPGNP